MSDLAHKPSQLPAEEAEGQESFQAVLEPAPGQPEQQPGVVAPAEGSMPSAGSLPAAPDAMEGSAEAGPGSQDGAADLPQAQNEAWAPSEPAQTPMPQAHEPITAADVDSKPLPRINIQAFCEDERTASLLQQASQDRRLARTHVSIQMGGLAAASENYRNAPTPNLIIIESKHKRDEMLADLDRLASQCDAGTKVIVIGHVNDVLLYRQLLQRGVSEYLVMPLSVSQLMESLSNLYNEPGTSPLGSVISFVGAKGGVGSSAICHNTAWAISQDIKSEVVIADLDLPFGTAGLDFNQDPVQGIADALFSPERLDEVLLDRLLSRCSDYLSLFAAPGTLDRSYDLSAGACDTIVDVLRKNVPYIVVDVPHIWTDWAQQMLVQSDRVVITAQPDLANLRNAKNLIEKLTAARPNDLAPHLVINQVGIPKRPEISVKDFVSAIDIDAQAVIEFDARTFGEAANNGQMIEEVAPKAKAAEQFRELARVLTNKTEIKSESGSLLAPILAKLNLKRLGK